MPLIDALVQPADDREIKAFKAWAKYPVPDEYLAFLREHNGGYLTGDAPCFYDSSDCTVVCITKFMHVSQDLDKCISKMFEKHFEFNTVKTQSEELRDNYFAPDYYIKIADGAQHGHILLDLKTGYIFSFDDETEEELETTEDFLEESFIIADSFDSFFSKIVDEGPDWLD